MRFPVDRLPLGAVDRRFRGVPYEAATCIGAVDLADFELPRSAAGAGFPGGAAPASGVRDSGRDGRSGPGTPGSLPKERLESLFERTGRRVVLDSLEQLAVPADDQAGWNRLDPVARCHRHRAVRGSVGQNRQRGERASCSAAHGVASGYPVTTTLEPRGDFREGLLVQGPPRRQGAVGVHPRPAHSCRSRWLHDVRRRL